jgi:hypothetical protein
MSPLIPLQAKKNAMDIIDCHHHSHGHSHGSYYDKNENTHPNFATKQKKRRTATCGTNDICIWGPPSSLLLPLSPLPLLPLLSNQLNHIGS